MLITGGAGFIGSLFTQHWLAQHEQDRVVVIDALTYAGDPRNLLSCEGSPRFRFVQGDIGDRELVEELLREEAIDTVVNFAAESHVDRSISDPDAFIATNIVGMHAFLRSARRVWLEEGRGRNTDSTKCPLTRSTARWNLSVLVSGQRVMVACTPDKIAAPWPMIH